MLLYQLGRPARPFAPLGADLRARLMDLNKELHAGVEGCKRSIDECEWARWHEAKRLHNPYELVPGAAGLDPPPSSRAFFKLLEILAHPALGPGVLLPPPHEPATCVFLCDAPGGFMECFMRARAPPCPGRATDQLHGMSLVGGAGVPGWKVQRPSGYEGRVQLHTGADGTGDVLRAANQDALVRSVGEGAACFVTADGGFDVSQDYARQEELFLPLLLAQVSVALRVQAPGGGLVLKVYSLRCAATLRLLHLLRECYRGMWLCKPRMSRPANSERYVVCSGHLGCAPHLRAALAACAGGHWLRLGHTLCAALRPQLVMPSGFVRDVVGFAAVAAAHQALSIHAALALPPIPHPDRARAAGEWCAEHGLG